MDCHNTDLGQSVGAYLLLGLQSTIFLQEPIILLVPNNLMESRVASGIFASRPGVSTP
jgi:hypothetical protein